MQVDYEIFTRMKVNSKVALVPVQNGELPDKIRNWTITFKSNKSLGRRKNVLKTSTGDQPSAIVLLL